MTSQARLVAGPHRLPLPAINPPFDDELGPLWAPVGAQPRRPSAGVAIQGMLNLFGTVDAVATATTPNAAGMTTVAASPRAAGRATTAGAARPGRPVAGPTPGVTDGTAGSDDAIAGASGGANRRSGASPAGVALDSDAIPAVASRGRPDPRRWCARVAQALAEILYGKRPAQQLLNWTSKPVYHQLTSRVSARGRGTAPGAAPYVRSLRLCEVTDEVVEACAVLQAGPRARAMAFRVEADGPRWVCVALEVG